jgi:hypothetical protein
MADCEAPARSDTRGRLKKHFLPKFVDQLVSGLTKSDLGGWLTSTVVESLMIPNVFDVPKCANRVLSMIKALLNHAVPDSANDLSDDRLEETFAL